MKNDEELELSGAPDDSEDAARESGGKHRPGCFFPLTSSCGLRSCSSQTRFLIGSLRRGLFSSRGQERRRPETRDGEALKWFLSGVFNPILLRFNKLHLNHI